MNYTIEYDKRNPLSIEKYSQKLIGRTFRDVLEEYRRLGNSLKEDAASEEFDKNKGYLGQIIEKGFFHYSPNNDSRPDFPEAGVELKVTPYKKNKNGSFSAKERLILTKIDYDQVVRESFEDSHLWRKSQLILIVYYQYIKEQINLDYKIKYSQLFTPPEQDLKIIKNDFNIIISKIRAGKAHELSEGDTLYLGAATKASSSEDRTTQPFSDIQAKPRAFAFKNSYMTYILNTYIIPGKVTYEPIIHSNDVDSLEDYVVKKISDYRDYSVDDLCKKFNIEYHRRPKNLEAMLAYRMLGIKGNNAEEFVKANIVVKSIRIEKNNRIKENMSFPTFRFKELIEETWDDSTFGNYLRDTRFLFVVYKYDEKDILRLRGCQFWNIPYDDLETQVKLVWEKTKQVIKDGLKYEIINGVRKNNLPKSSENPVCHVRPHAQTANDTYELPDGRHYPKQCFWLNNSYIYDQLDARIKG